MIDLDELQRLAEGAGQRLPGEEWFNRHELRSVLMAHEQDALLIEATSPDTVKKLVAVALAADKYVNDELDFGTDGDKLWEALRTALEELK